MGKNNPKIGDKVKAGGATWEYKRVNANGYGRSFLWVTQARIGIDISGKPVKRRIYAATPDEGVIELLTKRREFTAELDEARTAELHPTVRQAFVKYLEYVKPHLRKNTYDGYEQLSRLHLQDIFDIRLDKVTREDLQAAVNAELEKFSKKSVIKYVTIFNQVRSHFDLPSIKGLRYSDKTGGIREDDFSFMAHAHDLPAPADVVKKAAEFDGGRLYRFVIFGLMSMRIGEICGLTYGDISEHNGRHYITLRRQRGDKHDTWELKSRQGTPTLSDVIGGKATDVIMHPFAFKQRKHDRRRKKHQQVLEEYSRVKTFDELLREAYELQMLEDSLQRSRKP